MIGKGSLKAILLVIAVGALVVFLKECHRRGARAESGRVWYKTFASNYRAIVAEKFDELDEVFFESHSVIFMSTEWLSLKGQGQLPVARARSSIYRDRRGRSVMNLFVTAEAMEELIVVA